MTATLTLLLAVAGILLIVGAARTSKSVAIWCIVLAIAVPIALCFARGVLGGVSLRGAGDALVVAGLFIVLLAFVRFVNRKRQLTRWLGEKPTSLKRRVERE